MSLLFHDFSPLALQSSGVYNAKKEIHDIFYQLKYFVILVKRLCFIAKNSLESLRRILLSNLAKNAKAQFDDKISSQIHVEELSRCKTATN